MIKIGYTLNGEEVPYDSSEANIKLRVGRSEVQVETRNLPRIHYTSGRGLPLSMEYIPDSVYGQIEEQLKAEQGTDFTGMEGLFNMAPPESVAKCMARIMKSGAETKLLPVEPIRESMGIFELTQKDREAIEETRERLERGAPRASDGALLSSRCDW